MCVYKNGGIFAVLDFVLDFFGGVIGVFSFVLCSWSVMEV